LTRKKPTSSMRKVFSVDPSRDQLNNAATV
jgi:hypothetical protein